MKISSLPALGLGALTASPALAQATRIWISGVGDDANPCSRTAPCLTIQGSLGKVAAGGEIDLLDPVGIGPVTITKALTIDARGAPLGLQAPSLSGVVVNAGPSDSVTFRGLTIEALQSGTSGVTFSAGQALHLERCTINAFTGAGVDFSPAAGGALFVLDTEVRGAGIGVKVESSGGRAVAALSRVTLVGNGLGLRVGRGGLVTGVAMRVMQNSTAGLWLQTDGGPGEINIEGASIVDNGLGVRAEAPVGNATIRLSNALVAGNASSPTQAAGGGLVHSFGNNRIVGGSAPGCGADAGLSIGPAAFPAGVAGVSYASTELVSTGAVGEPTWAAGLPAGLSIVDGVVLGTPTAAGHFPFTLSLTDGNGCAASAAASIDVVCPMLGLTPTTLPAATTGTALSSTFTLSGTASTHRDWTETGALPVGVTFAAGVLAGLPTQGGSFPFTVAATDGYGCTLSQNVTLTVGLAANYQATTLALSSSSNPASAGSAVTISATVSGATSPTGTVTFFEGATTLGTQPVAGGVARFTTSTLAVGTHQVTAVYSGDAVAGASFAPGLDQVIQLAPTATSLVQLGDSTFEAEVTSDAGVPIGTAALTVDGAASGSAVLDAAGTARFEVTLGAGDHLLVASFGATAQFAGSTSASLAVHIAAPLADGGNGSDGGVTQTPAKTGCGCGSAEGSSSAMIGLVLLGFWRRRVG